MICIFLLPFFSTPTYAQVECAGEDVTDCLNFPFVTYQCINGNSFANTLYGTELLPPNDALVAPQYLIIRGFVSFINDYTFAEGSEIIFLDKDSGFKVDAGSTLTLDGCTLHGCNKLWAGVIVQPMVNPTIPPNTLIAKNCTFEDAKAAIFLRDKSVFQITGCTF